MCQEAAEFRIIDGLKVPVVAPIMQLGQYALRYVNKMHFIYLQQEHIRVQSHHGVTAQRVTVRCRCGWNRSMTYMFRCLYCKELFCQHCAELHFGQTVEEYRAENPVES